MFFSRCLILALTLHAATGAGAPPHVYLFESSKARAIQGVTRQRARQKLAEVSLQRYSSLFKKGAVSAGELDRITAAATISDLELQMAEIRAKEAGLSLDLARALGRNGKPIPLCRRKPQTDENTVSQLLKRPKSVVVIQPMEIAPQSGTKVMVDTAEAPEQPQEPPEEGPAPAPLDPAPGPLDPGPDPLDPPEPPLEPGPAPEPAPGPKPNPKPGPAPVRKPGP